MAIYVAIVRQKSVTDFDVRFPDFPDCMLACDTLIEVRDMAADVLGFHVGGLREDGLVVPAPKAFDAILTDPAHADGVAMLVTLAP